MRRSISITRLVNSLALTAVVVLHASGPAVIDTHAIQILLNQERFDEAKAALQTALVANPNASDLHRIHGDLLFRQGHIAEARSEYTSALSLNPGDSLALYGKARSLQVTGMRAQAASFAFMQVEHPWELASPYQHYALPAQALLKGGRITGMAVAISINGATSTFRLDTGAGGLSVSSSFAAKAGIKRIGSSKRWGIGSKGAVDTWTGYADELRIGDLEFRNVVVEVSEKGSLDSSGGLVGTDIFKRFLVKIDFTNHRVELDPLFGPAWDGYTPVDKYVGPETEHFADVVQVYHYLLIPTLVNGQGSFFLVDTGARFNSISTNLARLVTLVRQNHHMTVKGVSGKVDALYEASRVILQFAGFQEPVHDLAAFDLSDISRSAGLEVSGILGLPVLSQFQSMTIDYRDEGIRFDYKK